MSKPARQELTEPVDIAPASDNAAMLAVIERAAANPEVNIDKMERLLAMRERMEEREAKKAYNSAMRVAQEEMATIHQDMANTQTRSRYASYAALDKVIRPIYTKHGFSVEFDTGDDAPENHVRVICEVSHQDGFSKKRHFDIPADGKGAKGGDVMTKTHAAMSAVSYGRRGLLKMVFNLSEGEDDDGNAAGGEPKKITDEQADELAQLCEAVGADKIKFCRFYGIEGFGEIVASEFENAKAAIQHKTAVKSHADS